VILSFVSQLQDQSRSGETNTMDG